MLDITGRRAATSNTLQLRPGPQCAMPVTCAYTHTPQKKRFQPTRDDGGLETVPMQVGEYGLSSTRTPSAHSQRPPAPSCCAAAFSLQIIQLKLFSNFENIFLFLELCQFLTPKVDPWFSLLLLTQSDQSRCPRLNGFFGPRGLPSIVVVV